MLPENISIIAPIIATIGSTISICVHCRPPGSGISGGASSNNFAGSAARERAGASAAGPPPSPQKPSVGSVAAIIAPDRPLWLALAGRCRRGRGKTAIAYRQRGKRLSTEGVDSWPVVVTLTLLPRKCMG